VAAILGQIGSFWLLARSINVTSSRDHTLWKGLKPNTPIMPVSDLKETALLPFAGLSFADRNRIGVKAANLAEVSQLLGAQAPKGFAIPFAHYAAFLDSGVITQALCAEAEKDCGQEGREAALCSEVSSYRQRFCDRQDRLKSFIDSLLDHQRFQNDSRFREASLDGLRYLMRHIPVDSGFARTFNSIADSLFPGKRVRLRSSTNAEDLEDFNGAGLYSSTGADASDPEWPSDEIRKVWASLWNWQAFEERSFHGIDHRLVHMGVVVHPSFTAEKANGVLITRNLADAAIDGFYVNVQPGEISVTNPTDGSLPEIFTISGTSVIRLRHSSQLPDSAAMSDGEIAELGKVATQVHRHFAELYGKDPRDPFFALELEFKLDHPGRTLFIKQARPYSMPR
jgi:pyruvate, water dikinase